MRRRLSFGWPSITGEKPVQGYEMNESEKASAFDWLMEKLQRAYDGEEQEFEGLFIYCRMVYGRRDHRSCSAEINFDDVRDEPIGLAEAIRKAMQEESNVPSP